MENAEVMVQAIDVAMERLERLDLLVAELQGDLGAALAERDALAAENARLREACGFLLLCCDNIGMTTPQLLAAYSPICGKSKGEIIRDESLMEDAIEWHDAQIAAARSLVESPR